MDQLLYIGFGYLNLGLEDIKNMTPYEIKSRYNGYLLREEKKDIRFVQYITLWICNMAGKFSKKTLKFGHFFKEKKKPKYTSVESFERSFNEKRERYLAQKNNKE